ncbi:MAG: nitroreductase family protein [Deltaproteobacteria bacterium]|nr:nitroreductase family protein [Deltaproteobacteria bacterium]
MELKQAIASRASVREFTGDEVPIEDLREMVRLAGRAPSVNNAQPWRFIVVQKRALKTAMADAVRLKLQELLPEPGCDEQEGRYKALCTYCTFFEHAPAVVAVGTRNYEAMLDKAVERAMHISSHELRGHPDEASLGASIQTLLLAATDMGYGACWMTGPLVARPELEALLGIEHPWRLGALVSIGRPAAQVQPTDKLPVEQIFELRA